MAPIAQRLAIPAFFGVNADWTRMQQAAGCVGAIVADGSFKDLPLSSLPAARAQFSACRQAGQLVFGYVSTRSGQRDVALVNADIAKWFTAFPNELDGMFFDEGPLLDVSADDAFFQGYYVPLLQSFRNGHPGHGRVFLNASQFPNEWVMQAADFVTLWENSAATYLDANLYKAIGPNGVLQPPPAWWSNTAYTGRIAHIVWSTAQPDLATVVQAAKNRNAGLIYVFDLDSTNYTRLPTYWSDELSQACSSLGTGPETTIDSGPTGDVASPNATFTFSATVPGSTFECRLDGQPWQACSSPVDFAALVPGPHVFEVRATDPQGHTDPTPARREWSVRPPELPETTITSGPTGTVQATDATFAFTASKPNCTFDCRLDSSPWTACTSPRTFANLAPGSHTFEVRATDGAGNQDPSPAVRSWTIELPDPCELIQQALAHVQGLPIKQGTKQSMSAKLRNAHRMCLDGRQRQACHQMRQVGSEIERAEDHGDLTGAQATELRTRAERITDALACA